MTTPTATPVPSNAAADLLFNAEKIDEAVTSLSLTYLDRFGVAHKTLAGAVASISAITNRGAWTTATAYAALDIVSNGGAWYISLDNHTSGATFAGDTAAHWRIYQGVLAGDLADITTGTKGPGAVGAPRATLTYPTDSLGAYLRSDVNVFQWIPPAQWAAILNGTSTYDASASIISAITAAIARAPCKLVFPCGRYRCDAVLGTFTGSNITIEGNGALLDFSAISLASTATLLIFEGAYSTGVSLTSTANASQKSVACVSSGFAVGDFVRVYSEKVWDSTRTSTRYGELGFIETIPSGAAVTLTTELQSSYATTDTAKIEKLTPIRNVTIQNFRILGPGGNDELRGLRLRLGINCHLKNISSFDVDYMHMQLTDCIGSSVTGCSFDESNSSTTGYGVSFADACCDCVAYGNFFVNVRHSLSTNNNVSTSYGITRRIRFELNDIRDSAQTTGLTSGDAIDTHSGSEDIDIINNTVHSSSGVGINVEGRSARILGNRLKHTVGVGIYFHPYSDEVPNVQIDGNRVEKVGDGSGLDPGIMVAVGAIAPSRVQVNSNHCESSTSEAMRITGTSGSTMRHVTVSGNTLRSETGTELIYLRNIEVASVTGNTCVGPAASTGLLVEDCSFVNVSGGSYVIQGTATNGYAVRFIGTGTRNSVVGVTGYANGTFTNTYGVHLADTITTTNVMANQFPGITTDVVLGAGSGNAQANNQ